MLLLLNVLDVNFVWMLGATEEILLWISPPPPPPTHTFFFFKFTKLFPLGKVGTITGNSQGT